jgi:hypothetical protein
MQGWENFSRKFAPTRKASILKRHVVIPTTATTATTPQTPPTITAIASTTSQESLQGDDSFLRQHDECRTLIGGFVKPFKQWIACDWMDIFMTQWIMQLQLPTSNQHILSDGAAVKERGTANNNYKTQHKKHLAQNILGLPVCYYFFFPITQIYNTSSTFHRQRYEKVRFSLLRDLQEPSKVHVLDPFSKMFVHQKVNSTLPSWPWQRHRID